MGPHRIPLRHTNRFRLRVAEAFVGRPHWESVRVFASNRGLKPSTVMSWAGRIDKLRETDRQGKTTLGGSGRKSETMEYEDLLTMRVKDLRRERYIVTRAMIIFMAQEIAPEFFDKKTVNAALCWCARFMARNRLTLRRVTTRGRESREDMFIRKAEFCDEVRRVIADSVVPLNAGVDPRSKVFNMDQTGIFASTTAYTTVEQVGVRVVPALTAGSDSQRITMALLVRADGEVLPPHFVFKGQPGGEVEREVRSYAPPHVATCSVQENAWFDERMMLEWIEESFRPNVTSYSVLLLDALKTHKMDSVLDELGAMGTSVHFVSPGCTGIAQPLDVGVMSPLKTHLRQTCAQAAVLNAMPTNSAERRRYMFDHAMHALSKISADTVRHSFDKAGPFFGCVTSTDVQGMLEEASLLNVVDALDDDTSRVHDVLSGDVNESPSEVINV